jgi:hypothetical protein
MVDTPLCECGQDQNIKHVAEVCPLTKYEGGIVGDSEAQDWLSTLKVHL